MRNEKVNEWKIKRLDISSIIQTKCDWVLMGDEVEMSTKYI